MIDTEEITELLMQEIERHGLSRNKLFSEALDGARPSKPILVKRLDKTESYYYLVPMKKGNTVTAMASIDAMSGQLGGCVAYPEPIKTPFITRAQIVKRITGRTIDLGKGKIELCEGKFRVEPEMVWKPCKETLSPYYPLYVVTTATDKQIFIDYMGNVYTELHEVGPAVKKNNLK